jgi:hypothetical protein
VDRPLWQIVLSILLLSFAVQRAGAAAIAWGAGPREWAIATGVEAVAACVAAVCLWIGGRPAAIGIVVLGVALAASAALLVFVFGASALPAAVSRILVAAIGAGGFYWVFRREFTEAAPEPRRTHRQHASRHL